MFTVLVQLAFVGVVVAIIFGLAIVVVHRTIHTHKDQ